VDAVPLGFGVQWMKIEPGQIQNLKIGAAIERVEASDAAGM
jgi:hypothetical protein